MKPRKHKYLAQFIRHLDQSEPGRPQYKNVRVDRISYFLDRTTLLDPELVKTLGKDRNVKAS